jgi:hypothetical protein
MGGRGDRAKLGDERLALPTSLAPRDDDIAIFDRGVRVPERVEARLQLGGEA